MNKSDLKNFAVSARLELIQRVSDRAALYGIDEKRAKDKSFAPSASFHRLDGAVLSAAEIEQRDALIARVIQIGYHPAMEEAAYTWFNRFIAIQYMQEHNLLPVLQRVFPDAPGAQPQILREAQDVSLPGVSAETVLSLLDANATDELYKRMLIALCNALSESLPGMFEAISGATELLFPDALLKADSVLGEMAKLDADSWNEIQVIGWLYQYYNTQLKDETFELLKKNVKITKDRIGAATQLFTPEWIVDYMVENSLGRLWLEGHPDETLRMKWRYYMDEAEQTPEVAAKLAEIRAPYASIQPEQITVLDPCMGSGHILVYAFDVLMDIYRTMGYTDRDVVRSIVENNLYGLDIDDRAAQLAYFAVMMRACEYDRRFLRRGVQPHICSIQESAPIDEQALNAFGAERTLAERLLRNFRDAKEYGSILHVDLSMTELNRLSACLAEMETNAHESLLSMADSASAVQILKPLVKQAKILARKYDIVVTNPPYMGGSGMNDKLSRFVKDNYPDSKSDLFAVFIERCGELLNGSGYQAMITQHAWMFLSSFEKLRGKLQMRELISMAHLGARAFEEIGGEVVQTTAFVMEKAHIPGYKGSYARLIEPTTQDGKEEMYLSEANRYTAQQDNFKKIPGAPISYWCTKRFFNSFDNRKLGEMVELVEGVHTRDNDRFLRMWHEIDITKSALLSFSASSKWYAYNKGGLFRQWYGNNDYVVNWENDGKDLREFPKASIGASKHYFEAGITFTFLTSSTNSFRYSPAGFLYDMAGPCIYPDDGNMQWYLLGLFVSKLSPYYLNVINPTLNMPLGDVKKFPVINCKEERMTIDSRVQEAVKVSKSDWDSFETSWDFKKHPMI